MGTDDARADAELVVAAVGGDRAAFGAIYERYVDRVHGFSYSFLRSSADAADATQDTFVRAAEQLANLRDPSKLRPWLFAVARSVCLARLRRRGRDAPEADVSAAADAAATTGGGSGPVSAAEQAELARLVWDAAAALDDRDRLVLELTVRGGLDGAELADALGVSQAHAHVLAHRARQRVERALGAFLVARLGRKDCAACSPDGTAASRWSSARRWPATSTAVRRARRPRAARSRRSPCWASCRSSRWRLAAGRPCSPPPPRPSTPGPRPARPATATTGSRPPTASPAAGGRPPAGARRAPQRR
jgi:RNA polymerase sigma factor (sigma-70 family)